jgi:hypothetical protein
MNNQVSMTLKTHNAIHSIRGISKHICLVAFLFLLSIFTQPLVAQDDSENILTKQIWLDYNIAYPISESLDF